MNFDALLKRFNLNYTALAGPILILLILARMVLPLPTIVLDMFFTSGVVWFLTRVEEWLEKPRESYEIDEYRDEE